MAIIKAWAYSYSDFLISFKNLTKAFLNELANNLSLEILEL